MYMYVHIFYYVSIYWSDTGLSSAIWSSLQFICVTLAFCFGKGVRTMKFNL